MKVTGTGNAFATWTDAGGIVDVASLDAITGVDPGQIVKLADGSFLTPQFSTGTPPNNGLIQIVGSAATLFRKPRVPTHPMRPTIARSGSRSALTARVSINRRS